MMPILMLWGVPRSTSTPFEWMMKQRGDFQCIHEPFGRVWYFGDEAKARRALHSDQHMPGLTFQGTLEEILQAARRGPVFVKDFAYYVTHMWDDAFLAHFQHSFLIRDPAKVLASMFRQVPDYDESEVGIIEQRQLFDRLSDKAGIPPPLIDADDLYENPPAMVEAYCAAVGIPFIPDALTWDPPGESAELSWYDSAGWQASLRQSTGMHAKPRRHLDPDTLPAAARIIYDRVLPHYQSMHSHRLRS